MTALTPARSDDKNQILNIDLNVSYTDFSLQVSQKFPMTSIIGIFGQSGSGKSSLLKALSGLNSQDSQLRGSIVLNDRVLFDHSTKINIRPELRHIGLVFQNSRLFPHLTVAENLRFGRKRCANVTLDFDEIVQLTQLDLLLPKSVQQLSGGEQQRVALARAILAEPSLLLLDEPLSALDNKNKALMLRLLQRVQQKLNLPMLYVSHSLAEIQQIADYLLVLSSGEVTDFGDIHQVIHQLNFRDDSHQQTSLSLMVKDHLPQYGLTSLLLNAHQQIYMPLHNEAEQKVQVSIRCIIEASDISITLHEPTESSIVNHLAGEVSALADKKGYVLVSVVCSKQTFYVRITTWSAQRLALKLGQQVFIQFKASAVRSLTNTNQAPCS